MKIFLKKLKKGVDIPKKLWHNTTINRTVDTKFTYNGVTGRLLPLNNLPVL